MHRFYIIIGLGKGIVSFLVRSSEVIYSHLSDGPQHASVCCLCLPFLSTVAKAAACFASRRFPAASSAQADRASPAQQRERNGRRHREKDQFAQQLSRALRCCLPLPLRCTETHRCLPAASLSFTHEHGLILLSHTGSLT